MLKGKINYDSIIVHIVALCEFGMFRKFTGHCSTEENKIVPVLMHHTMKIYVRGDIKFLAVLTLMTDGVCRFNKVQL
jgi:hypothetical protein